MTVSRWLLAVVPLLASAVQLGCGEGDGRGPSTPDERARVIALARSLEREPLRSDAPASRRWVRQWMADVPDLKFMVCDELLGDSLNDYAFASVVKDQVAVSGAAFALEHQGKARDDLAIYTAGVEGALRAYEALLRSRPGARATTLDDLVARRGRGELGDRVAELATERCPKSRAGMLWIAMLAGAAVVLLLAFLVGWLGRKRGADVVLGARRARVFRTIVFVAVGYWLSVAAALHVLEPDYDPRFKFMSDYAWSIHGWLMSTTFFVLALAILAVALGLRDGLPPGTRVGWGLLVVAAAGVCVAGLFRGFPLHDIGSAFAFPGMLMAVLTLANRFRQLAAWRPIHRLTLLFGLLMLAALLSMVANVGWPGVQQRTFLVLFLVWLCVVANRLVTIAATAVPSR